MANQAEWTLLNFLDLITRRQSAPTVQKSKNEQVTFFPSPQAAAIFRILNILVSFLWETLDSEFGIWVSNSNKVYLWMKLAKIKVPI